MFLELKIDVREKDRISKAEIFYESVDDTINISLEKLNSADYLFIKDNLTVGFEYKTAEDFLNSITDHRVFNECYEMCKDYDYAFLIIEDNIDYAINRFWFSSKISYNKEQIKGAYRRIRTLCPVILVDNPRQKDKSKKDNKLMEYAFDEMYLQAQKCFDGKTLYLKELKTVKNKNPCITLLCLIKGVSYNTAKKITHQLDLTTQADYFNVSLSDLESVSGIGRKKAEQIINQRGEFL